MVKLNVSWSKEKYEVDYDPSIGFEGFQGLLFSLTNVPLERQKLMVKGKLVKDATILDALKDGDKVMLMGTADPPPQAPTNKIVFEEDLTDAQKIGIVKDILPPGLNQMGNTCYLASTLQCLKAVPELKSAIISKSAGAAPSHHDPNHAVVRELGRLYQQMDSTSTAVTPMMFTSIFRSTFPQFAETSHDGHWMQQDAEEALIQLMNSMAVTLKASGASSSSSAAISTNSNADNIIDQYFGGKLETRMVPVGDDPQGPTAKVTVENYRRLQCFIDAETNFLFQGIKLSLHEPIELRGVHYERTSTLMTLPPYLIVQMMRFDWRRDTQKKSKKLRKVTYPMKLDLTEFTHPTLKHELACVRNMIKEDQDRALGLPSINNKKVKTDANQTPGTAPSPSPSPSPDTATSSGTSSNPWASGGDNGSSTLTVTTPTAGFFDLYGIVTHKGRTSDSGHYVAFTKQSDGRWMKFDDDVVSEVDEEKVKNLAGGGDDHMAYLLFYKRNDEAAKYIGRSIPDQPKQEEKKTEPTSASAPAAPAAASAQ